MTKDALTAETRQLLSHLGCQASDFAGHSYKIGAATAAASASLPPWLVKTLGRWSSDCFERYIQCPQTVTGSFIRGCFEATSNLKLVIVTLFVQQQLQPQQASPPVVG